MQTKYEDVQLNSIVTTAGPAVIHFSLDVGRFQIRTVHSADELNQVFALRYQAFCVEMAGASENQHGIDRDAFDEVADHLAVFDKASGQVVAACRIICSKFSDRFYSEQEFDCRQLLSGPRTKLELGRVCVRNTFRNSILMALLWRGIAEYIIHSKSEILFGCGSISTLDPNDAAKLYMHFKETGKLAAQSEVLPNKKYHSTEFEQRLFEMPSLLTNEDNTCAVNLIPPLCRSYFEMGCRVLGKPAFDYDFKCIDFLLALDLTELSPRVKKRMFGTTSL